MKKYLNARLKTWSLAFGFWTLLAVIFAMRMILSAMTEGGTMTWARAFAWNLPDYYLWMMLTPLVGWLGRSTAGRGWRRFFAVHIPCSIAVALLQISLQLLVFWTAYIRLVHPDVSYPALYYKEFVYTFQMSWVVYWVVLVVLRGIEYQRRLRDERLRSSKLETQLARSQLQALRVQLQPHFLFNTLNTISALALSDPEKAREMIARLSDFLRLTLEERHLPQVPLSHELQFLDCYLAIQRVRFQDRLTTRMDVADDTLNASVPNLILQPLVENALRHGILPKSGAGTLHVATRREGDNLHLLLEDDGLGLPENDMREGIGLGNTRERLKMLFGKAGRLDLTRIATGGTRIELRFPFRDYAA